MRRLLAKMILERLEDRLLPSAGDLDVVFAGGKATANFSLGAAQVEALAVQADGRIVAAGQAGSNGADFALARFNRNGTLDASFGTAGEVATRLGTSPNSVARGLAIQPDGKILVAGFAGPGGSQEFALARYNQSGSLDSTFGDAVQQPGPQPPQPLRSGSVLTNPGGNASATSVAVAPDGKILVAGSVQPSAFSSASDFALVRYNADGSLDTTFGTGGIVTTKLGDFDAGANTVLIVPDANTSTNPADYKIVAAGHTSTSGGNFNFALVRYNADGTLDTTFHTTGVVTRNFGQLDDIHDAVLQADGKIVAVGSTFIGGKVELALARYDNDGSLDTTFGTAGQVTTDLGGVNQSASSLVIQPDGKLVVAGVYAPNGPSEFFLARYLSSGSLDATFGTNGKVLTPFDPTSNAGAASLVQLPDGTFVAGGSAGTSFALARYWGDNSPPAYALSSANAVYVNLLYEQLLARPADAGGLSGWVTLLTQTEKVPGTVFQQTDNTKTVPGTFSVVAAIEQSQEYRTRLVDNLYATLLARPADPAGEAGFVQALGSGTTIEQVKAIMLGSPEYFQRAGSSNLAFLQALYHTVLNRALDPAGQSGWSAALAREDRATVAAQLLASPEAEQDLVAAGYLQYLHRPADPAGLAGWLTHLQQGMSDQTLTANLLGSDEFFNGM